MNNLRQACAKAINAAWTSFWRSYGDYAGIEKDIQDAWSCHIRKDRRHLFRSRMEKAIRRLWFDRQRQREMMNHYAWALMTGEDADRPHGIWLLIKAAKMGHEKSVSDLITWPREEIPCGQLRWLDSLREKYSVSFDA